jgi:hypothetical protein
MADNPCVPEESFTVVDPNLAPTAKRACSECGGDVFSVEDVTSNAGAKGVEGLFFQCHSCGVTEVITFDAMEATADYT